MLTVESELKLFCFYLDNYITLGSQQETRGFWGIASEY